jgi:hypothetical protein
MFYETLFRKVFAAREPVLVGDVRSYCLATHYGSGLQLDGALELLLNIGILSADHDYLRPDKDFLHAAKNEEIGFAISTRLIDRLVAAGEIQSLFPAGSLSWGKSDGELNIHLSHIPMRWLAVVKLLRDLEAVLDSEEGAALLRVRKPFSGVLQASVALGFSRARAIKILTPAQLGLLQEAQARQGADAEEYVLRLERNRLREHPQLQLVRRISLLNTAAGYDIESFEGLKSFLPDRFIEVKSHRGAVRFFLSLGEMEAAKELGDRYYLYVIDMDKCGLAEYSPFIIRNPVVELFDQHSEWSTTATNFEIVRKIFGHHG